MPDQRFPKSRRRWLRMSVRGLIVLVLLIGVALSWVVHSAHIQRDAVAAIESAGGTVIYDWEAHNSPGASSIGPWWAPAWLMERIGIDYFGHVVSVSCFGSRYDAPLVQIQNLERLEYLALSHSRVVDAGLAHLSGLTSLKSLFLRDNDVSDAGLVHLGGLTGLEQLDLYGTRVSGPGFAHLRGLKRLEILTLERTPVTDVALEHLKALTGLRVLNLDYTEVSDAGLAHLKGLTNLQDLSAGDTHVTDAGVQELQRALPKAQIVRILRLE
jgi:internalin A